MKVAYLIFAHNVETLHGAERLIHWLYHRAHTFVIHIDYAAPVVFRCYLQNKYSTESRRAVSYPKQCLMLGYFGTCSGLYRATPTLTPLLPNLQAPYPMSISASRSAPRTVASA
jgi:late competence protein required for DNA uptake (superfamily II DNA/RNA helicase)